MYDKNVKRAVVTLYEGILDDGRAQAETCC